MGRKYYAVKKGYDQRVGKEVRNVILDSWNECALMVKGVKGAIYKSFESKQDAEAFLDEGTILLKKGVDSYPEHCIHAYVDGSYNINTKEYGYGFVIVKDGIVQYVENGSGLHKEESNIRQIAGELMASVNACRYAAKNGYDEIVIFHDYEGVCHHATGFWGRKDESSKEYYETMQMYMDSGLKIVFVKVDSHTGDIFNEVADEKSKEIIGVPPTRAVEKYLKTNPIYVVNNEVKKQLATIALNGVSNIKSLEDGEEDIGIIKIDEVNEEKLDFHRFKYIEELYKTDEESALKLLKKLKKQELLDFTMFLLKH